MNLNAVDVDRVLVKRPAADIVLRTQFIILTHAGEGDEQALYRTARGIGHDTRRRGVDMVHRALRMLDAAHFHLRQPLLVREQLHIDIEHLAKVDNTLLHGGITDHGEIEHNRIRLLEQQFIEAVLIRSRTYRSVGIEHHHIRQLNTHIVLIHHVSVDAGVAGENRSTEYRIQNTE